MKIRSYTRLQKDFVKRIEDRKYPDEFLWIYKADVVLFIT